MNCVRCGKPLQSGQAQCSCGQYVDLPASELYTLMESQVEKSSKDNFRRGLLIGLGFLFMFLILETVIDLVFIVRELLIVAALIGAAAGIVFIIWLLIQLLIQKLRSKTNDY